jgi:heparan-alpha-glucosaminide N-acetyltransferase
MNKSRLGSIDVLRALVMFFMVFVNDLWTIKGVPVWLEHAPGPADAMGFSDIIFPAFLFIVGLSIPFAIKNRIARGQSRGEIFKHILLRALALIVMGFFHVNMESYSDAAVLPEAVWKILITLGFFLIWLEYKADKIKKYKTWLQGTGILLLVLMAFLYKGNSNDGWVWMQPHWWGILGLIGWAYLLCASIILWGGEKMNIIIGSLLFFIFFNAAAQLGWIDFLSPFTKYGILDLGNASNSTLVMAGVLIAVIYRKQSASFPKLIAGLFGIAVLLFLFGFITRPLWGISKIRATPSWTTICAGISILSFAILIYIVDKKGKQNWFEIIKPAGTSTLTCYLLPYFHEAIFISLLGWRLPMFLRTGAIGIIKCLVFALIIVLITGWLEKRKIRLRI